MTKLEKVIDILKNYIEIEVNNIGLKYSFNASYILKDEDFKLLKEVLKREH